MNSSHIRRKFETSPKLQPLLRSSDRKREEIVAELYLTILSRFPTDEELKILETYAKTSGRGTVLRDLAWALINCPEFSYRH